MRNLARPDLAQIAEDKRTQKRLEKKLGDKTRAIEARPKGAERVEYARAIFEQSRDTQWFALLRKALQSCEPAGVCMYCSASEESAVDHFLPITECPEKALCFANYVLSCSICNNFKGTHVPEKTLLNPFDDNIWEFFFLDPRHGRLIARVDPDTGADLPRAAATKEVVKIDREFLQLGRKRLYQRMKTELEGIRDAYLQGTLPIDQVRQIIDQWRDEPFQVDVADYFLDGPGKEVEPFRTLFEQLNRASESKT